MLRAWQTPHGARPNRERMEDGVSRFPCVPARCAKLPGRSLEPISNDRPRGMTVSGGNAVQNSAYRPDVFCGPWIREDSRAFNFACNPERSEKSYSQFTRIPVRLGLLRVRSCLSELGFLRVSASPRCAFAFPDFRRCRRFRRSPPLPVHPTTPQIIPDWRRFVEQPGGSLTF